MCAASALRVTATLDVYKRQAHNALSDLVHTVELSGEAGVSSEVDHGVDAFLLIVEDVYKRQGPFSSQPYHRRQWQ